MISVCVCKSYMGESVKVCINIHMDARVLFWLLFPKWHPLWGFLSFSVSFETKSLIGLELSQQAMLSVQKTLRICLALALGDFCT